MKFLFLAMFAFLAVSAPSAAYSDPLCVNAKTMYAEGDSDNAKNEYQKLAIHDDATCAWLGLGRSYLSENNPIAALMALKIADLYGDSDDPQLLPLLVEAESKASKL